MEGDRVTLGQHDHDGSRWPNYADLASVESLAFQREGVGGGEGGREGGRKRSWNTTFEEQLSSTVPAARKEEHPGKGVQKAIRPYGTEGKMETRAGREDGGESGSVTGAIRPLGVLRWGEGTDGEKMWTPKFGENECEKLNQ